MVFIGKVLLSFQTSPSTFSFLLFSFFFFVNFDFSYFFVFFENEQYQRRLDEENQWFKNDAWKVGRVWKSFKNLNSFLDDVENAKMTRIY